MTVKCITIRQPNMILQEIIEPPIMPTMRNFFLLSALFSFICINIELYNGGTMFSDLKKNQLYYDYSGNWSKTWHGSKGCRVGQVVMERWHTIRVGSGDLDDLVVKESRWWLVQVIKSRQEAGWVWSVCWKPLYYTLLL